MLKKATLRIEGIRRKPFKPLSYDRCASLYDLVLGFFFPMRLVENGDLKRLQLTENNKDWSGFREMLHILESSVLEMF